VFKLKYKNSVVSAECDPQSLIYINSGICINGHMTCR